MRVIAGSAKGRELKFPKLPEGKRLRPLTGQAKEALFNILAGRIEGARFLDLFAGTGSVGIEALSRGAALAFFVEMERRTVETLRQNLEITGFQDRAEVFCMDVIKALGVLDRQKACFDIVFIGAPYGSPLLEEALKKLSQTGVVGVDGVVIAEHSSRDKIADSYSGLVRSRDARYGDTVMSFYSLGAKL